MEKLIVLDTNCLLQALGAKSRYRKVWTDFLNKKYTLCVSNEIMHEYEEILKQRSSPRASTMFMMVMNYSKNVITKDPYFKFELIKSDPDDNKFVDCAIACNAEYIVTDDSHFEEASNAPFPLVKTKHLDEFLHELESESKEI